jgi:hypothetical protein
MTAMKRLTRNLLLATLSVFALSACGYQGSYRYSCQDPENWEKEECNPPMCTVNGDCWKDLVDYEEETDE